MKQLRRFVTQKQSFLGLIIVGGFFLMALAAPQLAPPDPEFPDSSFREVEGVLGKMPQPPSELAWLGTTADQYDIFYTLVWGTRSALVFGITAVFATALLGTAAGALSGFYGGVMSGLAMRVTDAFLAFPAIAGVVVLRQVLSPTFSFWLTPTMSPIQETLLNLDLDPILVALILFSWMPYARLINTTVAQVNTTEYIQAARVIGVRKRRILLRHVLPNAISPAIVLAARDVGGMVILEAAFTFIGLGGRGPWGQMLVTSRDWIVGPGGNLLAHWWVYLPITVTLVLFGIGWNLLGDGLNTALNPRSGR